MKHPLRFFPFLIFICFTANVFAQKAGSQDTSFNRYGFVSGAIPSDTVNEALAVAVQNDGKIVVAGYTSTAFYATQYFVILRYTTNGSLDTSFDKTGYVVTLLHDTNYYSQFDAIIIEPSGKILVGGGDYPYGGKPEFVLEQVNENGTFDTTFGNRGIAEGPVYGFINSISLQKDGKIIAGGPSQNPSSVLARYDSTGNLDSTFGINGTVYSHLGSAGMQDYINGVALQSDNKIVTTGYHYFDASPRLEIARYNSDGSLDDTFGQNGIDTSNFGAYEEDAAYSVVIQNNGKIVIGGYVSRVTDGRKNMAIIGYNSDGSFDTSFGINGLDTSTFYGFVNSLILQPDGKIVAAGTYCGEYYIIANLALLRLNSNGVPDTSFADGGLVVSSFDKFSFFQAVALQPDEKLVAAGYAMDWANWGNYFVVERFISGLSAGILQLTSTPTSVLVYPNPVHNTETLDYTLTNTETLSINLYDITGRFIRNYMTNGIVLTGEHKQQLNFDNLTAGSYILTITNEGGKTASIKIIKQ